MTMEVHRDGLKKLRRVLNSIGTELGMGTADVPVHTVLFLLEVALTEEDSPTIREIGERIGLASSSATRNSDRLGSGAPGIQGVGLIESRVDPLDRRRKALRLTTKGTRLMWRIAEGLE